MVSTIGLLSGIAVAGVPRPTIILTGIILIFVEAISMAAGSFLSEYSVEEETNRKPVMPFKKSLFGGGVMFFSYFIAGFIPLFPYLTQSITSPFKISVSVSLVSLFILGLLGGKAKRVNVLKRGIRMVVIGGFAIAAGIIVGGLIK